MEGAVTSPVVDIIPDPVLDPSSRGTTRLVEMQSPDEGTIPSVADSIIELNSTNPLNVLGVQPSSLVDVGTVEIVTVNVHAAWGAAESPLPDPVDDTEAQRSSPGVGDIQQSTRTHDRTQDLERIDSAERNPTAATHVQQEDVRQVETPSADVSHVDLDSIRTAQAEDDSIKVVVDHLSAEADPGGIDVRQYPEDARQLLVSGSPWIYGMESCTGDSITQMELPSSSKLCCRRYCAVHSLLHAELGHFGRSKTALAVSRRAYFPAWRSFMHLVVKNCSVCNQSQHSKQPQKQTKLRPMTEFRPMVVLHADLVGPILPGRNSQGQRWFQYILSVVDSATRYLWLLPLRQKTADEVAAALCEHIILRVSAPSAILTDQGKEFTGAVVQAVCDRLGITRLRTSGYHPQTDSEAERVHFSVHNMITKLLDGVNPSL